MSPNRAPAGEDHSAIEIAQWRCDRLIAAGFPSDLADAMAADRRIDLHVALELTDRGCPPELAARILAPLDTSPSGDGSR
jgi:hypothetical protein